MAPRPTRIHLVRHGRVEPPWPERVYGRLDVPLSADGLEDARRAAERLAERPLEAVWSSGLVRAEAGAELLRQGRELARHIDARLEEIDRGRWAGRSFAAIESDEPGALARWSADPGRLRSPEGESLADVAARALPALGELARLHPGGEVAVVAHSWVIRVAVCHTLELPLRAAPRLDLPPGSLTTIDWPVHDLAAEREFESDGDPAQTAGTGTDPNAGRWSGRVPVLVGLNLCVAPERV